ncbi:MULTISPECIES: hypothetical protein [Arthrobacter]|uniref:hypothetical protein n=1 Tax=Arthrobacter TaxID=1663 RepID=UPI0012B630FA|nr:MULTISPECIES: hypothetical protein [Arthrobacter]
MAAPYTLVVMAGIAFSQLALVAVWVFSPWTSVMLAVGRVTVSGTAFVRLMLVLMYCA